MDFVAHMIVRGNELLVNTYTRSQTYGEEFVCRAAGGGGGVSWGKSGCLIKEDPCLAIRVCINN